MVYCIVIMSHFFTKYKVYYLLILGALFYLIKLSFNNNPSVPEWKQLLTSFYYVFIFALSYFLTIQYIVPLFVIRQNIKAVVYYLVMVFITGSVLLILKYYTLTDGSEKFEKNYWSAFNLLSTSYLLILLLSSAGAGFRFFTEQSKAKLNLEIALKEKMKSELDFLKAQLNPHFIFNSINAAYVQIDVNPGKAKDTLHTFSELLRYQLYECNADQVPVAKELEYLNHYIKLQKVRKDNRYQIEFNYPSDVNGLSIAPLLLIPFVENAFKYVSNYRNKVNTINLQINLKDDLFCFNIRNSTDQETNQNQDQSKSGGIGLANAKRRLELIYPQRHELEINTQGGFFEVNLIIKLR